MAALQFDLQHTDANSSARAGMITTDHGQIQTPIFMPVGTVGSVKGVTNAQLNMDVAAQIILGNTYHLYLRPGTETLQLAGGIQKFTNWNKPVLTDSGGFQVFSLAGSRKITENGVVFRSHIDGSKHLFTPESVIQTQRKIGGDIMMAFDECPPGKSTHAYAKAATDRTHRWLNRCIDEFNKTENLYGYNQNLFPIVQGGTYKDLRLASCEFISAKNAVGNAIGGLSVGEPTAVMYEVCGYCCENLPMNKPRYLMGVGTPWDLLECISLGVDMFDCVMPTRNGRNAMLFTANGVINIDNKKWEHDFSPIDETIPSQLSQQYSKAYLRHLFKSKELLAFTIASVHNLSFYLWLVAEARKHILQNTFTTFKAQLIPQLKQRL